MYSIKVEGNFSSAHNLRGYKGKCEALHGHNWKVEVSLAASGLNKLGMVADFSDVKKVLRETLEELDHTHLNELPAFKKANPTSENIARYLFGRLRPRLRGLLAVTVWESPGCCATYSGK